MRPAVKKGSSSLELWSGTAPAEREEEPGRLGRRRGGADIQNSIRNVFRSKYSKTKAWKYASINNVIGAPQRRTKKACGTMVTSAWITTSHNITRRHSLWDENDEITAAFAAAAQSKIPDQCSPPEETTLRSYDASSPNKPQSSILRSQQPSSVWNGSSEHPGGLQEIQLTCSYQFRIIQSPKSQTFCLKDFYLLTLHPQTLKPGQETLKTEETRDGQNRR